VKGILQSFLIKIQYHPMKSNTVKLAASSKLASHSLRPKGEEAFPMQLLDNRPEALAQAQLQEQINNSPRVMQLRAYQHQPHHTSAQREASNIHAPTQQQAASGGVVQLSRWDEWDKQLAVVAPNIQSLALFGMAIVQKLEGLNVKARIGGSLAAKMLGARRNPGDIDLEIPGDAESMKTAKSLVWARATRENFFWVFGQHVFLITKAENSAGVIKVGFKEITLNEEIDELEIDADTMLTLFESVKVVNTAIDFSSESEFAALDMEPSETKGDDRGHYSTEYLIASYLNRLATNKKIGAQDEKNDSDQILDLMKALISKGDEKEDMAKTVEEVQKILLATKDTVMSFVKKGNSKEAEIEVLWETFSKLILSQYAK
jgi:hypothetical protein